MGREEVRAREDRRRRIGRKIMLEGK